MALGYVILNHRGNVIKIQIRQKTNMKSQEKYLQELKQWLHDTSDSPLEEMSDFLNFCHCYDSNPFVCGMGKDNLLAQGEL